MALTAASGASGGQRRQLAPDERSRVQIAAAFALAEGAQVDLTRCVAGEVNHILRTTVLAIATFVVCVACGGGGGSSDTSSGGTASNLS